MKNFNKIHKYLTSDLPKEESENFESKIQQDPDLALEVEQQRLEYEILKVAERESMRKKLQELRAEHATEATTPSIEKEPVSINKNRRKLFPIITAIAASIILVIGLFQFVLSEETNTSNYQLALELDPYSDNSPRRGDTDKNETEFRNDFLAIVHSADKKNVQEAINYFLSISDKNSIFYPEAQMYLGKAYLLKQDFKNAANTFQAIENSTLFDKRSKDMAEYYLAVTYLLSNQEKAAQETIKKINTATNHRYKKHIKTFEQNLK